MAKYHFSKELEGKTLECGDMLMMGSIIHLVGENHLLNLEGCGNGFIFYLLDIKDKEEFCEGFYGYQIEREDDGFPSSKNADYEALTRVAIALMKTSEEKGFLSPMVYSTSEELKNKVLGSEDKIIIGGVRFVVDDSYDGLHLEALGRGAFSNYSVFNVLGISDRVAFCKKYYGYIPSDDDFPETDSDTEEDYRALTRLTIALMRLSEFKTVQNALDECSCVKEHLKTPSLIPMVENLEKILEGKDPNSDLSTEEIKMVRELFNSAEDQIHKK